MMFPSTVRISDSTNNNCGSYSPEICDFIVNKWVKWLGHLVHHTFSVKTKICSKIEDPDCTVKDVFQLMLLKRKFIAPAYREGDSEVDITTEAVTELIGPNLLYSAAILSSIAGISVPLIGSAPLISLLSEGARFTNPVKTKVVNDATAPKIINTTLFPHIFFPGTITRTIKDEGDGIYVETWGEGDAVLPLLPYLNIIGGEVIFKTIDEDMAKNWRAGVRGRR